MGIEIKIPYEIIDDKGTIHSGKEDDMYAAFDVMTNPDEYSKEEIKKWWCDDVEGDLRLVKVLLVHR